MAASAAALRLLLRRRAPAAPSLALLQPLFPGPFSTVRKTNHFPFPPRRSRLVLKPLQPAAAVLPSPARRRLCSTDGRAPRAGRLAGPGAVPAPPLLEQAEQGNKNCNFAHVFGFHSWLAVFADNSCRRARVF